MEAIAKQLPPIHRAGFEYQFSHPERGLDFQQGILTTANDYSRLTWKSGTDVTSFLGPIQKMSFEALRENSTISQCIKQIWLEFDSGLVTALKSPSVFLGLQYPLTQSPLACDGVRDAYRMLTGRPMCTETALTMGEILRVATELKGVSHAGFMLGRKHEGLRLVLPICSKPDSIRLLFGQLKPQNEFASVEHVYEQVRNTFPDIRLCIDIHRNQIFATSLECFFRPMEPDSNIEANEKAALKQLVDIGLCSSGERDALLGWVGELFPQTHINNWPEDLILTSLTAPENHFSRIETGLSHIKVNAQTSQQTHAKVYFGYRESCLVRNQK
ncbi:MAG: hypothetical protein SH820_00715 [Xanthomonadales bacterium]|nr:hypothetical protein [Xanthomonadales bacterium]